ncbi:MAG: MFS transporter [Gammaproteobacteria bacterium]|nr:MFS transporter [Gammaproteobacteria bacterium]
MIPSDAMRTDSAPGSGVRRYVLGILVVVYTFNFIDRQILSILLQDIKEDLGLSDSLLGLLSGFAFAAFYATLGIPIARYADRANRRNLIAYALALWSGMTALSGLAQNFWQLLAARIGVGIGEAGCTPPANAILSDYYPPEQRATAFGIYAMGIPIGILFGFLVGGWINEFFGWRKAFFIVGLPGLLLAILVRYTVREPVRGQSEQRVVVGEQPSLRETFEHLRRKRAFVHLALGGGLTAFVGYSWIVWMPAFLMRSHGMSSGEVGTALGLIVGIAGAIGIAAGGYLADRVARFDRRWSLWLVSVAVVINIPFAAGVFFATNASDALLWMIVPFLLGNFWQGTSFAQTQGLVGLRMRAVAAAVLLFIVNMIGLGAGPQLVGIVSDLLNPRFGADSLRWALAICSLMNLWAAVHFYIAGRALPGELDAQVGRD